MQTFLVFLNKIGKDIGLFINNYVNHLLRSIGLLGNHFYLFYY